MERLDLNFELNAFGKMSARIAVKQEHRPKAGAILCLLRSKVSWFAHTNIVSGGERLTSSS